MSITGQDMLRYMWQLIIDGENKTKYVAPLYYDACACC